MLLRKGNQTKVRRMGSALDHLDHQEEISQIFHGRFSCPQQSINCHESIINGRFHFVDRLGLLASLLAIRMVKKYFSFYDIRYLFEKNPAFIPKMYQNSNFKIIHYQGNFLTQFPIR